jgi:hypothetical protein
MKIIDIQSYIPQKGERFIIDTNIWLYLFCPIANYKQQLIKPYEKFFETGIKQNSWFHINSLIISEFINRYFRLEFNILNSKSGPLYSDFKKDYRGSKEFLKTASIIKITLQKNIFKISKRIDDQFSKINIDAIINSIDEIDFTDEYISNLSSLDNIKIVTNDFDFGLSKSDIVIITANTKLLKHVA